MNNKITFPRLATLLADRSGRSKRFSEDFLREFFSLISETLEAHESVKIKGFGTFRLTRVEPRRSVDVTTGEPMEISGHTKVVFTPAKELAEAVNAPFEAFTAIEISDDTDIEQLFNKDEIEIQNENEDPATEYEVESALIEPSISVSLMANHEPDEEIVSETKDTVESLSLSVDNFNEGIQEENHEVGLEESTDFAEALTETINETKVIDVPEASAEEEPMELKTASDTGLQTEEGSSADSNGKVTEEEVIQPEDEENAETEDEENAETEDEVATQTEDEDYSQTGNGDLPRIEDEMESSEEFVDYEEDQSAKRNWMKGFKIALGAAVVALFATFIIWYVFATHDFNGIFNKTNKTSDASPAAGFVVGKKALSTDQGTSESGMVADSIADSGLDEELEEEVPTAPSDALVYDTIGNTRYLTTMAKAHYGNYNLWPYIYEENKSFLGHPDRIRPGTPVVIPKLSKYGVDASKAEDIEKAKKLGVEIYARYGKKI